MQNLNSFVTWMKCWVSARYSPNNINISNALNMINQLTLNIMQKHPVFQFIFRIEGPTHSYFWCISLSQPYIISSKAKRIQLCQGHSYEGLSALIRKWRKLLNMRRGHWCFCFCVRRRKELESSEPLWANTIDPSHFSSCLSRMFLFCLIMDECSPEWRDRPKIHLLKVNHF